MPNYIGSYTTKSSIISFFLDNWAAKVLKYFK